MFIPVVLVLVTPAPVVLDAETEKKLVEIAFQAARADDAETLAAYFSTGRPVNGTNGRGDTLLTVAAYAGSAKAVEVVLKQKAVQIDARNKMGLTALSAAAFKGHVEIAKSLVARKADVNAANGSKQTPMMFAALAGRTEMVKYLLAAGAKADTADASGNTPLSLARGQGATDVVKLLENRR
jgi:uncharacterized protein